MDELKNRSEIKVLVVGDVMIDRYWWGKVSRISPEAPVPVVQLEKKSIAAGGAANVAANIKGLGAEPILIGIIGTDEEAQQLRDSLKEIKVSADYLIELINRPTTVKTRIIAHSQQVVRLDQEDKSSLSSDDESVVWEKILQVIDQVEIIVVSDYAKGLLTDKILKNLLETAKEKSIPVLVDPKGIAYEKYTGATLLTPNQREAAEACNLSLEAINMVEDAGRKLLNDLQVKGVLVTEGENGMTLFQSDSESIHFDALARNVYDVTGAGDTVIATLAVALGSGATLETAAKMANVAAGIVVEKVGTTPITFEELKNGLG